ncbi:hypothetical protein GmHk_08G022252 [Glycine max]|nr:hypothetical protein GmHk_08G022252 [Glycine max]
MAAISNLVAQKHEDFAELSSLIFCNALPMSSAPRIYPICIELFSFCTCEVPLQLIHSPPSL